MNSKLLHQRPDEATSHELRAMSTLRRVIAACMLGAYMMTGIVSPDAFSILNSQFSIPRASAAAGINPVIHYQGKISLLAGSAVGNGSYNMRFKIYDAVSAGTLLWSETWSNATARVTMTGGLFSVGLGTHVTMTGSVNFNTDSLYLQIEFDPGNDGTYEEIFSPRRRFASVPYAHNANTLDGIDSTTFLRKDAVNVMTGSLISRSTISGAYLHASNSLTTSGSLTVKGAVQFKNYSTCAIITTDANGNLSCGSAVNASTGSVIAITDGKYVKKSGDTMTGALTIDVTDGNQNTIGLEVVNTISGAVLHANKVLRSSGALVTESGAIFDDGTLYVNAHRNSVGIGTTTMNTSTVLSVKGLIGIHRTGASPSQDLGFIDYGSSTGLRFGTNSGVDPVVFVTNGTEKIRISSAGHLGIGTNAPGSRLSISGAVIIGSNIGSSVAKAQLDVKGSMSGTILTLSNLRNCNLETSATGAVICGTDADTTYYAGQGLSLNSNVFTLNTTITGALVRFATLSGSTVYAKNSLASSGTLVWEGRGSGSYLWLSRLQVGSSISASGSILARGNITTKGTLSGSLLVLSSLRGCTLKTSASGNVICGTDLTGGPSFGTGNVLTISEGRYVNVGGDTMTGALTINLSSGYIGLRVIQTASGSVFHAEKALTSSGQIIVRQSGVSRGSGALTVTNSTRYGTGAYMAASGAILVLDSTSHTPGSSRSPHILFGYKGNFDVALWRSAAATLSLSGSLLPSVTNRYTLGSNTMRWKDLFLSGSSLHVGTSGNEATVGYNTGGSYFAIGTTSQTNAFTILNSNGNVGIGKANPATKLDVRGTISGSLVTQNGSGVNVFAGNVAIGTTNGMYKLEVLGSSIRLTPNAGGTRASLVISSPSTTTVGLQVQRYDTNGIGSRHLALMPSGGYVGIGTGTNDPKTTLEVMGTISGALLTQNGAGTNYFMGNVGIGRTTISSYNLAVQGAGGIAIYDSTSQAAGVGGALTLVGKYDTSGNYTTGAEIKAAKSNSISGDYGFDLAFNTRLNGGSSVEHMRITGTGSVGIGTASPSAHLHVLGGTSVPVARFGNTAAVPQLLLEDTNLADGSRPFAYLRSDGGTLYIGNANRSGTNTTASVDRVAIDSSGRVGIGTSAPDANLTVSGSTAVFHIIASGTANNSTSNAPYIQSNKDAVTMFLGSIGSTSAYGADESAANIRFNGANVAWGDVGYYPTGGDSSEYGHFRFSLASSTIDRIPDAKVGVGSLYVGGNVGIGTTAPSMKLDVLSSTVAAGAIGAEELFRLTRPINSGISFPQAATFALGTYSTNNVSNNYGPDTRVDLNLKSASDTDYGTDMTAMTWLDNGNVGIGTNAPRRNLEAAAATGAVIRLSSSDTSIAGAGEYLGTLDFFSSDATAGAAKAYASIRVVSNGVFDGTTTNGGAMVFHTGTYSAPDVERMRITQAGDVGIGTTGPKAKLDVVGTISGSTIFGQQYDGGGLTNCTNANEHLSWNSSTKKFSCTRLQTNSFSDTTADTTVDDNTTNYWDGTTPSITPSNSSREVLVIASIEAFQDGASNTSLVTRIERNIGSIPTCNSSTVVGPRPGIFLENFNAYYTSTVAFVDAPSTASTTYYTLCADEGSAIGNSQVTRIDFTLFELDDAADLAEVYPTNDASLQPGDIAALDPELPGGVRKARPNDRAVIGVVSTRPGLVIGGTNGMGNGVPVALSGRVPVKVTTENGPIAAGDLLGASSMSGVAMKATATSTVIGRALKAFSGSSIGTVDVFVQQDDSDGFVFNKKEGITPDQIAAGTQLLLSATNDENRSLLKLDSEETTGSQNLLEVISDVGSDENTVFAVNASGAVFTDSTYNSSGADYAEWFAYSGNRPVAGEVVCIDITKKNAVKRCENDADSNVMGIVSTNPAFIGNSIGGAGGIIPPGYVLVGLIGQVPAKVVIEGSGSIRAGDALTAASVAGYARKAQAGESTVGVALEPFDGSQGSKETVNVLISRRNSSLTVDAVGDKVLKTIADMQIDDEVQLMVSSALGDLNVDQQISEEVTKQIDAIMAQNASIESIQQELAQLKDDLARIKNQTGAVISSTTVITQTGSTPSHLAASSLELDSTLVTGGDARIGGNLSIDGTLNASSLFVPNGLTIDGGVTMNGVLDAQKLHITEEATVDGMLTINGTLKLGSGVTLDLGSGALTISQLVVENALFVMGDITIKGLATFLGDINVKGELIVSNNQAGFAMIPATGTSVTVRFGSGFKAVPVVTATPQGRVGAQWWVEKSSATGFTIAIDGIADRDVLFSWFAVGVMNPIIANMETTDDGIIIFPTDEKGVPVSSNMAWNACIRNITILDDNGQPLSCARYHDAYTWTHPDLNMTFIWNTSVTPSLLQLPPNYQARVMEEARSILDAISETEDSEEPVHTGTGTVPVTEENPITEEDSIVEEEPIVQEDPIIEEEEAPIEEPVEEPTNEPAVEDTPIEEPAEVPATEPEPAPAETPQA